MDLSSVGGAKIGQPSFNSEKGLLLGKAGESVSNQELKNLCETITNNPNKKVLQMFQVGPEKTFTIEGQLQFPANSEQDGWQESLDQVIDMIYPNVESLVGAFVEGSAPILELLEYVSQDDFIEVFKADVSNLTTDSIQTIYNQNPEFFNAISSGAEITQESAKKFLEDVLRETASTGEIMRENVVEIVQTYVGGFIEKIHDEDFQQQISNNIDDFSTSLVDQLQTAYGSIAHLATAINENIDLLGQLVIGEGDDASWELQPPPPQNFEVSSDKEGFFQILSDAWNAATRQTIAGEVRLAPGVSDGSEDKVETIAGEVRLAPGVSELSEDKAETIAGNVSLASSVSDGSENTTETIADEVQIKEGVEYLNTLTLNQINAYPTQIKERLDPNESAEDKLQTLASCAKNLEDAAKVVRITWKDQALGTDEKYNDFLKRELPKLTSSIDKLQDLSSLNASEVLQIEKTLYTLKEGVDKVVVMLGQKDLFGSEIKTDLKPFFESAMQTSLALINGAYGAIRSSGSIDEASQHFDDRQAVLDASDALDPVFDNLNTLLEMNGFTNVLIKDGPQPIDVKNNEDKSLADFLQSNNISQAAFLVFRSACNDLKYLKSKKSNLEFSDSDKSKLAKVKTEVEQLYSDSSIESKVNDALIEMRKPDDSPIDPEKAKEVITDLFEKRLAQNEDVNKGVSGNVDPTSVTNPNLFE